MKSRDVRSDAENYRQERKDRIKKDAAKTKKGSGKAGKIFGKIVAVVLCVAIVGGIFAYLFNFFGWPQKLTTVATVKVGEEEVKVNQAKFNFYYMAAYSSAANMSYQYSMYGMKNGFDYTQSAESQKTKDDDGNEITYAEKFKNDAIESLERTLYYASKAKAEGVELTAEDRYELDETMSGLRQQADKGNMSLSAYIIYMYGKGLNAKLFEDYVEEQLLANRYLEVKEEKYVDAFTEDEVKAVYDKNPDDYKSVSLRVFGFSIKAEKDEDGKEIQPEYTPEQQQARAAEMLSKITDEESYKKLCLEYCEEDEYSDFKDKDASLASNMDYSTVKSNMGEEEAKWAFSADRHEGETTMWTTDSYIYVVYMVKPAFLVEQSYASVRHLLVQFPEEEETAAEEAPSEPVTDEDGNEVETPEPTEPATHYDDGVAYQGRKHDKTADETIYKETPKTNEDAKRIAEDYLERYNKTDKTEMDFAKLADLYSDDTSSTSAGQGEGGLIADMKPGAYVKEFEAWAYDKARKPGDVEIIETEYGYHIMYFVEAEDEPIWKTDIRHTLADEKMHEEEETVEKEFKGSLTAKEKAMNKAYKKCVDLASALYIQ